MPDDINRVSRDVEDIAIRLRALENLESPMQSQAITQLRQLQRAVERINEQGALATRGELALIKKGMDVLSKDVEDLEAEMKLKADAQTVKELSDDRKALVRIALAAVVAALLSLGVSLILRATGGG